MSPVQICLSRKTNLCTAIRATQGKGVMPDGTSRFSIGGKMVHHYMGSPRSPITRCLPEIAVAKIREDAPFDKVCYIGCGVTTGIGAVINTGQGRAWGECRDLRLGRYRLERHPGRSHGRSNKIIGVDVNPRRKSLAERFGMTHFVNPKRWAETWCSTWSRSRTAARTTASMRRQRRSDAPGAGVRPPRLGRVGDHRSCRKRAGDQTRPFQLVTGRVWKGTAFGGARGRTDVPKIVDWYMDKKINIDDLITHVMPWRRSTTPSTSCTRASRSARSSRSDRRKHQRVRKKPLKGKHHGYLDSSAVDGGVKPGFPTLPAARSRAGALRRP